MLYVIVVNSNLFGNLIIDAQNAFALSIKFPFPKINITL